MCWLRSVVSSTPQIGHWVEAELDPEADSLGGGDGDTGPPFTFE